VFFDLATRLKELRKVHRLTQEACSERSGISYKYYQAIENGRKRDPRLSTLQKLAKPFGIQAWQIIAPTFPKGRPSKRPVKAGKQR
jgi:transcriptional regulator with XRE-family HTH domain